MRLMLAKVSRPVKTFAVILAILTGALIMPLSSIPATLAQCSLSCGSSGGSSGAGNSLPYFKVSGGDVASGAWFNNDSTQPSVPCTSSGYYQAPDWTNGVYTTGGILSFAKTVAGNRLGSNSDYAAYSLGLVENNSASNYGFYTGNAGTNNLTFANIYSLSSPAQPAGFSGGGGLFEGNAGHFDWHCIPDYYSDYLGSSASDLNGATSLNLDQTPGASGLAQYKDSPASTMTISSNNGTACLAAGSYCVPASKNYTIFVHGNVWINTNIVYASHNATNIPRFALVVLGNIYVSKTVTQLDGIYIAEPDPAVNPATTTTGQLDTCHDNSATAYDLTVGAHSLKVNCTSRITFNGSVIAAQIQLSRLAGDVTTTPAETFNYSPETALGGSFTLPSGGVSGGGSALGQIDSLTTLPPVF